MLEYGSEELLAELIRLLEKQIEAVETAASLDSSDTQFREYDKRQGLIGELLAKLRKFKDAA